MRVAAGLRWWSCGYEYAGKRLEKNFIWGAGFLTDGYKCATSGKWHAGLRRSFAADPPDLYSNMNREERDARCVHGSDQYTIDQTGLFTRGWRKMITGLRLEQRSGITRERAWD